MEAESESGAPQSEQQSLVTEYVQNLLDVVSQQLNLHVQEMRTLERLNKLTLSKQS